MSSTSLADFDVCSLYSSSSLFFFTASATTEIYTLSLHDALPICVRARVGNEVGHKPDIDAVRFRSLQEVHDVRNVRRSEEHTSELQSRGHLVCRLLLEKKKKQRKHVLSNERYKETTSRRPSIYTS